MIESLLAGAIALAHPMYAEAPYTHPDVEQVLCDTARGTAWRISPGRYVSVSHVSRHVNCKINGLPIIVEHDDPWGDFSLLTVPGDRERGGIKVNCRGYFPGRWYYSVGFARGNSWSVVISLRSSGLPSLPGIQRGWSVFQGLEYVIPGMSGGPILNEQGEAVGTVNAYNDLGGFSWSRSLRETVLCQG